MPGTGGYLKVTQNLARVCVVVESVDHRNLHIVTLVDPSRCHGRTKHAHTRAGIRTLAHIHARPHARTRERTQTFPEACLPNPCEHMCVAQRTVQWLASSATSARLLTRAMMNEL